MVYTVHMTGTNECISEHSSLEAAIRSAVGSGRALAGERTIREGGNGGRPMAKLHDDGCLTLNIGAANELFL